MFEPRSAARERRAFLIVVAITVLCWAAAGAIASAHAYVVSADPPVNGRVDVAPRAVAISFDEPVDLFDRDAIEVVDEDGRRVDLRDASIDPNDATRIVVHLLPNLRRGIYEVRWRVISADTHVVHGSYSIGIAATPGLGRSNAMDASPFDPSMPLAAALRWLVLVGALLLTGAIFLRLFAFKRLLTIEAAFDLPALRCTVSGCAIVLLAAAPSLLVQTLAASAGGLSLSNVGAIALHTYWGHALIVRVAAAAGTLAIALRRRPDWSLSAAPPAALILLTFSITGHAAAMSAWGWRLVAESNDFLHLLAVATWVGGVLVMALTLPRLLGSLTVAARDGVIRELYASFSPTAVVCAAIAIATGTIAGFMHVPSLSDLTGSTYGLVLVAKVALVALLLAFGYRQLQIGRGKQSPGSMSALRAEAVVALAVLVCSAVLIGQAPPHAPAPNMHMSMKEGSP